MCSEHSWARPSYPYLADDDRRPLFYGTMVYDYAPADWPAGDFLRIVMRDHSMPARVTRDSVAVSIETMSVLADHLDASSWPAGARQRAGPHWWTICLMSRSSSLW